MDKDRKPAVSHGVAGWYTPVRCLQPWASAMGSVPALPQASFESISKALDPCSTLIAAQNNLLWESHSPALGDDPVPKMPTVQPRKRAQDTQEPLQNTRMLTRQSGRDLETVCAHWPGAWAWRWVGPVQYHSPTWCLAVQHIGKHPDPFGSESSS